MPSVLSSLTTETVTQLHKSHYTIIDNFLTEDFAELLLGDAEELFKRGSISQHYFQFGGTLLKKPNIYELDLSGDVKSMVIGAWSEVLQDVGPEFMKKMDELDCVASAEHVTLGLRKLNLDMDMPPAIKLQINAGGGSFPWHYDNPGPPNKRSLTCVVYLNPNWSEGDGGEIILWPFLQKQIIIPPLNRRAVLFYSDCMLHRVLPSNERRVCFTMWFNGTNVNSQQDVALSKYHLQFTSYDQAQEFFASSPLQRVISRAVYSEEYLESLVQCLVVCNRKKSDAQHCNEIEHDDKEKLMKQHESSVLSIMTKLRPLIQEFRKRKDALLST